MNTSIRKSIYWLFLLILISPAGKNQAQFFIANPDNLLNKPKDIVYDAVRKCCYISSYQGNSIVRQDSVGTQEYVLQGINSPMGLHLCSDTLIISSNLPSMITALNVTTDCVLYQIPVADAQYLAMMDLDPNSGMIYIVDQNGSIFKLNFRQPHCSLFVPVNSGIHYGSQTLEVDTVNNRLLVFKWAPGFIRAVSLSDSTDIINASSQYISQIQASQRGSNGEIYASSYINNGIYCYPSDLSGYPAEIVSGLSQPSGIAYNPDHHSLLVCNYGGNFISEIPLFPVNSQNQPDEDTKPVIYPNPSNDACFLSFSGQGNPPFIIRILTICGNLKRVIQPSTSGYSDRIEIQTSGLVNGIYLIQVIYKETKSATCRLIVNHP
ncbi:MAG: T9SS type A sorting domain-containing protein [Bacteroidales bacterium]|nr:T9SS type A sorting domain-containing protein [Bacteroidales bacterium]